MKKPKLPHYAMTQREVARQLGISRSYVWLLERSAMRKLRRNRETVQRFRELVEFKMRGRAS